MSSLYRYKMRVSKMTDLEVQILTRVAQGYSGPEITKELELGEHSVVAALQKIRRKLEARNTTHAAVIAVRQKLI